MKINKNKSKSAHTSLRKKLIVANWKMNPLTAREAMALFTGIKHCAGKMRTVQTVVCPPHIYISELGKTVSGHRFGLGAQDGVVPRVGAHTGSVSFAQLAKVGAKYTLIGHSERRANGETNKDVNAKVVAAIKEGLTAILCVGENERDEQAEYFSFLRDQLQESLADISSKNMKKIIIAYEPVWAVGENAVASDTPEGTHETVLFIKKTIADILGSQIAFAVPVLYGGSVNKKNTEDFLVHGGVQGLLVRRASLNAAHFGEILTIANRATNKE